MEPENLIMSVEKYPCLWDVNNLDYHDRNLKDLAWEQICKEIFNDWENCTDKANKCAELKKKWNNIRDYYRKEINKTKNIATGSAAKKQKTYIYGELLYFLTPLFDKRYSQGNYSNEDSDSTHPQLLSENENQNIEPEDINNIEPPVATPLMVNIQKKKKDVPTQVLNMLQQKQKTTSNTDEDDDTKFLLSFRSYMKKMNSNQKIDFQMGMLQLVKKINMGISSSPLYLSDNSSMSLPSPYSVSTSYTPVPQNSPSYYNVSSPSSTSYYNDGEGPSPTFVPSLQQNMYVPSPVHSTPPATFHSSSQQNNFPCTSTSKPKLVIHSITKLVPPQSTIPAKQKQNSIQEYPVYSIPDTNIQSTEDSEAAQYLMLQSQDTQEDSIQNYLKFN